MLLSSMASVGDILRSVFQILILGFFLYKIYVTMLKSRALPALRGVMILAVILLISYLLKLDMLLWIFRETGLFLMLIIAVVFQPELRKMFTMAGNSLWFNNQTKTSRDSIEAILSVAEELAAIHRGALITLAKKISLKTYIDTGVKMDSLLSSSLLKTIFSHDTPLHDGSVIIQNNRIVAAGCFLPITKQDGLKKTFGSRHRAALGLAEETDAVTIVVSEETGAISITHDGILYYNQGVEGSRKLLKRILEVSEDLTPIET